MTDRTANEVKLTEAKWQRFTKELAQYDGYSARLRGDFGIPAAELMVKHRLVEHEIEDAAGVAAAIARSRRTATSSRCSSRTTPAS